MDAVTADLLRLVSAAVIIVLMIVTRS